MLEQLMVQQLSYPVQLRATRLNLTWPISASISDLKKGLYARKVTDFFHLYLKFNTIYYCSWKTYFMRLLQMKWKNDLTTPTPLS